MRFILILLAVLFPSLSFAHGDYAWIMEGPQYKNEKGVSCCSERDCFIIPESAITKLPTGYRVEWNGHEMTVPDKAVYLSKEPVSRGCFVYKCLFLGRVG